MSKDENGVSKESSLVSTMTVLFAFLCAELFCSRTGLETLVNYYVYLLTKLVVMFAFYTVWHKFFRWLYR